MKLMKKILAVMIALMLLVTLAACAWEEEDPAVNNGDTEIEQPTVPDENNTPEENELNDQPPDPEPVEEPVMEMTPAELTDEEEQILSLVGLTNTIAIYDFTADDTLQVITAYAYELGEDGAWHRISGAGTYFSDPQGRLSVAFDLIGESITLSTQGENETNRTTHSREAYENLEEELAEAGIMTITEKRRSAAEIVYGEEILIAIQGMSSNREAESLSLSDFDNPQALLDAGYEQAYALTVVFSDQN